jgi:hypothetical protein
MPNHYAYNFEGLWLIRSYYKINTEILILYVQQPTLSNICLANETMYIVYLEKYVDLRN